MSETPKYLRHKLNGGIYRWTPFLDARWKIDGDMEPFDPEKDHAPEGTYSEVSEDPRVAEPQDSGADSAGAAGGSEPEGPPQGSLNNLHWTALKKLVESKGGTYTNKAAALAFLQ